MSVHNYYSHTILDHLCSPHSLLSRHPHRSFNCSANPHNHIRLSPDALLVVPQQKSRQLQNFQIAWRIERDQSRWLRLEYWSWTGDAGPEKLGPTQVGEKTISQENGTEARKDEKVGATCLKEIASIGCPGLPFWQRWRGFYVVIGSRIILAITRYPNS